MNKKNLFHLFKIPDELGPTDDQPDHPMKSTENYRIPVGKMNYSDRAMLRREMEALPIKRHNTAQRLEREFIADFI